MRMKEKHKKITEKRLSRKKRTELFKSVLVFVLLALFCFQCFLIFRTNSLSGMIAIHSSDAEIILNDEDVINLYFEYTAPEYIMVSRDGNRDVYYSNSEYYQKFQLLLQEINRSIFMPDIKAEYAEDGIFDRLTEIDSVYVSYPCRRYPKYTAQFLNNSSDTLSSFITSYTKVIIVPKTEEESETVTVYIKDDKTGKAVRISTAAASDPLKKYIDGIKGLDKKDYAFSQELKLGQANTSADSSVVPAAELGGNILIPLKNLSVPDILVQPPLEFSQGLSDGASYAAEEVMRAFGFSPSNARRYSDNSGVLVCVDERATLKLYPGGVIEYSSVNKESGLNLTGSSKLTGNNSYFLSITGISRIINSIIPLAGNMDRSFKIRLTDLQSESVEVSEYKFMFDYYINGIRITGSPYHGIEATAVEGRLTSVRINLKRFETTHNETVVEPLISAIDRFCRTRSENTPVSVNNVYLAYPLAEGLKEIKADWAVY